MCTCNAERQKKSANSSHFKEDDSALPLQEASRLFWENSIESFWQNSLFFVSSFLLSLNILKKNSFHKLNDLASSAVCKKPFSIVKQYCLHCPKINLDHSMQFESVTAAWSGCNGFYSTASFLTATGPVFETQI